VLYLRQLRKEKGLSQERLATMCDLERAHLSRVERGITTPTRKTLDKLARALGVEHPGWLVMPVSPGKTFGDLIEGGSDERRDYILFWAATEQLKYFVRRLEEFYEETKDDDASTRAKLEAVYMLGYARALQDEATAEVHRSTRKKSRVEA
jgi:transcriptional regulator with XRE-family HTH domain